MTRTTSPTAPRPMARPNARPMARAAAGVLALLVFAGCGDPAGASLTPLNFVAVAAGGHHSCGVLPGGAVYCWGEGNRGQLGDGQATGSPWPVRTGGDALFTDVSLGDEHSCGLTNDGHVRCWGWNRWGQLGTGTHNDLGAPTQAWRGDFFYASVTAGWHHTCALTTGGEAYCWGQNALGQLGDGTHQASPFPVRVGPDQELRFMEIAAGGAHTCAITTDGVAYCWGLNYLGQLGTGDRINTAIPTRVAGAGVYTSVTAGFSHSCALTGTGEAYCWGSNTHGELGNRQVSTYFNPGSVQPTPVAQDVWGGISFTHISAGLDVTCGVGLRGRGFCWGAGFDGQLGSNDLRDWSVPRLVVAQNQTIFTRMGVGGGRHVCAVTTTLAGYCWGTSDAGALGPRITFSPQPILISPGVDR